MTTTRVLYAGTVEYLQATLTSDVVLTDQTIEFSFDRTTWITAEWLGDPATTRTAQVLVGDDTNPLPTAEINSLYVRLTDNPEIPVMLAGKVLVK